MKDSTKKNLIDLGFKKEVEAVENEKCPICGKKIDKNEFRDERSRKEYEISGICQECQDENFQMILMMMNIYLEEELKELKDLEKE